jgi:hypothetical protein
MFHGGLEASDQNLGRISQNSNFTEDIRAVKVYGTVHTQSHSTPFRLERQAVKVIVHVKSILIVIHPRPRIVIKKQVSR